MRILIKNNQNQLTKLGSLNCQAIFLKLSGRNFRISWSRFFLLRLFELGQGWVNVLVEIVETN